MWCLSFLTRKRNKVYTLTIGKCDISYNCIECAICCEEFDDTPNITLPCGHIYHATCILKWFDKQMNCPICRKQFMYQFINKKNNT